MEEWELVEFFEDIWSQLPKNVLQEESPSGRKEAIWFACEVGPLRLFLAALIGPRGGLRESIVVIDPAQRITVDRLQLAEVTDSGDGHLLPLRKMRYQVRRQQQDPVELCRERMATLLQNILADPEASVSRLRKMDAFKSSSLPTLSGGLPDLGKRR